MVERAIKDNRFELSNRGIVSMQRNSLVNSNRDETGTNKKIELFDPNNIKNEFDINYLKRKRINDHFDAKSKTKK